VLPIEKRWFERGITVISWATEPKIVLVIIDGDPYGPIGTYKAVAINIDPPEVIKVFRPKGYYEFNQMMRSLTLWNYDTLKLCPIVKMEHDATS
jgi:hypothetical protein